MIATSIDRTQSGNGKPAWLDAPSAASLARVDAALGRKLAVTWAGRSRAEQQALWDKYGSPRAAYPGTSPHEKGNAIDTDERPLAVLTEHGWWRPLKAEPWHFLYSAKRDKHLNDSPPSIPEEDDMFVAVVRRSDWYLVSGGKACLLGAASNARKSGAPILYFPDDWSVNQLKSVVKGIK